MRILVAGLLLAGILVAAGGPAHADVEICGAGGLQGGENAAGGGLKVAPNNWNTRSSDICVTSTGGADFTVSRSTINWGDRKWGGPGAYPNIGTVNADPRLPIPLAELGVATSSLYTTGAAGAYNTSYDIWYNNAQGCTSTTPYVVANPSSLEIMVWLNYPGIEGVLHSLPKIAGDIAVGGRAYDLYKLTGGHGGTMLIYAMKQVVNGVDQLDLVQFSRDAVARGELSPSTSLCKVEAGFEIHDGGAGLRVDTFSLDLARGVPNTQPGPSPTSQPATPGQTTTPGPTATPGQSTAPGQSTVPSQSTVPGQPTSPAQSTAPLQPSAPVTGSPQASVAPPQSPDQSMALAAAPASPWKAFWNDEFDAAEGTAADSQSWKYRGDETQVVKSGGYLAITTDKDTAASVTKEGNAARLRYGRVEARISLPSGLTAQLTFGLGKILWPAGAWAASTGFHDYAINWYPDRIDYLLDGAVVTTTKRNATWTHDRAASVTLGMSKSSELQTMVVDHVRTFQSTKPLIDRTGTLLTPTGLCADARDPSEGAPLQIIPCSYTATQKPTLTTDGTITVQGKCLAATATTPASPVSLAACNGTNAQQWLISGNPTGTTTANLISAPSGLCLSPASSLTLQPCSYPLWKLPVTAFWPLNTPKETTAADASGGNRDATCNATRICTTKAKAGPAPATGGSFTISTRVKLKKTTTNGTAISQDGTHRSRFTLGYDAPTKKWVFRLAEKDADTSPIAQATSTTTPTKAWTSLTAVYDAEYQQIHLYVNGTLESTAPVTGTAWSGTTLTIGATKTTPRRPFPGSITQTHADSYALTPPEIQTR